MFYLDNLRGSDRGVSLAYYKINVQFQKYTHSLK